MTAARSVAADPTNPQQPTSRPTPSKRAAAAPNPTDPDETKLDPTPIGAASRRSNPQQPIDQATPTPPAAAASPVPEQQSHVASDTQVLPALLLWDPVLQTLAEGLTDIEATRIAQANRYRILTTTSPDSDGQTRGFGLPEDHPAVAALDAQLKTLEFLDAQMAKALSKQLRQHPLHPWIKAQKGMGDKTVARLLAAIKDPYWNDLHNRPRDVSELHAFCGVAGPGYRRTRGQKVTWNPEARKRLWIMTDPMIRGNGPYRAVYNDARTRYADKLHTATCPQCGPKGKPAEPGTPWTPGHQHAGARRLMMRQILSDLWEQGRDYYEQQPSSAPTPIWVAAAASTGGGGLPGVPATTTTKEPA